MKHAWMLLCVVLVCMKVCGQTTRLIEVSGNQTTSLLFPSEIVSIDRGNDRIVVQKSIPTILRVKADSAFTDTTNLTVITADGKLYSFLVRYAPSPATLTIDLGAADEVQQDTALLNFARKIRALPNRMHGVRYSIGDVQLSLNGVFTNGNVIAVKLMIKNYSPFVYEVGRITSNLGPARTARRKAEQERALPVLLADLPTHLIKARQVVLAVLLVPKSAFTPTHTLQIMVQEKGGERHLLLEIPRRLILHSFSPDK